MELTTTLQVQASVSARLSEDGTLSLKVFATTEYAPGKTTTAEIESHDLDAALVGDVQAALQKVLSAALDGGALGEKIQQAKAITTTVAAARGEI